MERESESVRRVRLKVLHYLRSAFGEGAVEATPERTFRVRRGPCVVEVAITPWLRNEAMVSFSADAASAVELRPSLFRKLLELNGRQLRFGAFGLSESGAIVVNHVVLGSTLDSDELKYAVQSLAVLADRSGERILDKYGNGEVTQVDREYTTDGWDDLFDYDYDV